MTTLELIVNNAMGDTEARRSRRVNLVRNLRLVFISALLGLFLLIQFSQNLFFNHLLQIPVLVAMSASFLVNLVNLLYFEKLKNKFVFNWILFAVDTLVFTVFVYCFGPRYSLFVFLYLVNIVLGGLVFERRGAFYIAALTAILYNCQALLSPPGNDETSGVILAINNAVFFSVAFLSGFISEQFRIKDVELESTGRELQILKNLNDLIVGNITSGLITTNTHGRILFSNDIVTRLFQSNATHVQNILPQIWQEVGLRQDQKDVTAFRREIIVVDKAAKTYEVICSPLRDENSADKGFLFLIQDLTSIKNLEKQLKQKEKLAAVGQLAAGIAHEIRNPLASISGSIQMLSSQFQTTGPEEQKLFRIVLREIDRLNELIAEFLNYVKPEPQVFDQVQVSDILKEVMSMVQVNDQLPKGVKQEQLLQNQQMILGNANKLKQAFLNIIMNAYQAMANSNPKNISVTSYDDHGKVIVTIADTGPGISEENLARIFEPFFTTKSSGTGLGLAMTYKIIENHQAMVEVESEVGKGTKFRLEFPAFGLTGSYEMPLRKRA